MEKQSFQELKDIVFDVCNNEAFTSVRVSEVLAQPVDEDVEGDYVEEEPEENNDEELVGDVIDNLIDDVVEKEKVEEPQREQ